MKKKLGILAVTVAMAGTMAMSFGLSACGKGFSDFEMPDGGYDGKPVTITFYNTMGDNLSGVFASAVERFNEIYPNITVVSDSSSGDYDTLRDKLSTEIQTGVQPNLAFCYPDHVALYNEAGVVLPLNDFLPTGKYTDMMQKNEGPDGEEPMCLQPEQINEELGGYITPYFLEGMAFGDNNLYTLPYAKSTELLYYNKTYFKNNYTMFSEVTDTSGNPIVNSDGELQNYMTWDQIFAISAKIKASDSSKTPLGIDSEANLFITLCEQYGTPYTSATGDHYLFNTAENQAFVQKFHDWFQQGLFTTQTINKAYTSNLFKEQKTYLSIGSSAGAQYQAPDMDAAGGAVFEVGIVNIPQVDPAHPKSISQGPSICIFKQKNPQEVVASWLFAKFITTDVTFQGQYSMTSGYVPVLKSVFDNPAYQTHLDKRSGLKSGLPALSSFTCKELVDRNAFYTSPAFNGSSKAREQVGILMVAALTETKSIDDAFKDAVKECEYFSGI